MTLAVRVLRPTYLQPWFLLTVLLLAAVAIWLGVRRGIRAQQLATWPGYSKIG